MKKCLNGHEVPAENAFCTECGTPAEAKLDIETSSEKCRHNLPASGPNRCDLCDDSNLAPLISSSSEITQNWPSAQTDFRSTPSSNPFDKNLAKVNLSEVKSRVAGSGQVIKTAKARILSFLKKVKALVAGSKRRLLASTLALVVAISSVGVYKFVIQPNYKALTLLDLYRGKQEKVDQLIKPLCTPAISVLAKAESNIETAANSIKWNYQNAYDIVSPNYVNDMNDDISSLVADALKSNLGTNYSKLDHAIDLESNGATLVMSHCNLSEMRSRVVSAENNLNETISSIRNPGVWYPSGYFASDSDRNIAYKWAPHSSYPNGGWAVDVIARLGCDWISVTLDATYGDYSGSARSIGKGGHVRVKIYSDYRSIAWTETGYIASVTCSN